jgi:hypothetical protein
MHATPPKTGKDHNPDRENPRPGASPPCTAQHTCTRPTARRDRHRLHHWGRERNRRRRNQHQAHARECRGRGRGHRRRTPAPKSLERTQTPSLHRDEGEIRPKAPEDRTPHLLGARPHDGARTVDVHPGPLSPDSLHHLRREELQKGGNTRARASASSPRADASARRVAGAAATGGRRPRPTTTSDGLVKK